MADYYKKVIYLSYLEQGNRIRGAGFIKIEVSGNAWSFAMRVSGMAELADKLLPCGELGRYLVENTFRTVERMWKKVPDDSRADPYGYAIGFPNGESWSLGDSVGIGVLLSHHSGSFQEVKAPNVAEDGTYFFRKNPKTIRWYRDINQRLILEDLFAKMKESYGKKRGRSHEAE